jgi:Methylase involved in ubiquinone/menaquinone biosynthesis
VNNEIIKQWDSAARLYFSSQEDSAFVQVNKHVVRCRFNRFTNEKVLDLGCGYGYYSDYFRTIGGNVVGCDGSKEMLSIARDQYPLCAFEYADFGKPLVYSDNEYDIVFCNQVLMDIENLNQLIREIYRITKQNGIFYMSIVHPAFYDCEWDIDQTGFRKRKIMERYLSEYSFDNEHWGKTKHFHRTVSKYLNTIIGSGFTLVCIDEPKSYDGKTKSDEFPLFLFAEFRK